ncbi:DUF4352 domain-containing protein [Agathobacter sp.]
MTGRNIKMAAVAFTAIITLTGCGTQLYDMTDAEQSLIANYSAYVVAKHNIYQQDGMTNATEDTEKVDEVSPDNSHSQDNKTSEAGNDKNSNSQKEPAASQEKKVSLAEATGYGSLDITYNGATESDVYNEGSYYSMTAGSGNTFAVMKFTLKNPTGEDINVDMFGNARTYKATFPDGKEYTAEGTFLTYSLNTFQGTVKAGGSVDVVLLFKIPQGTACDNITMSVIKDNEKSLIEL